MIPLKIVSTGTAHPARSVTEADFDALPGFTPGLTLAEGGARSRYFASHDESRAALGAAALFHALSRAGLQPNSLCLVIAAGSAQPDGRSTAGGAIAAAAGLPSGSPSFDVNAGALSFPAALRVAAGLLSSGGFQRIAVVSVELPSLELDWSDRAEALSLGDGAACAIVERGDGTTGIEAYMHETYPGAAAVPRDCVPKARGKAMFRLAAKMLPMHLRSLTCMARCTLESVDLVVPQQVGRQSMTRLARRLGLPEERVIDIYDTHANQGAASLPTALHEAIVSGRAALGARVMLLGATEDMSLGGAILRL